MYLTIPFASTLLEADFDYRTRRPPLLPQTTSLWRRSPEGQTLCNACSLYQKMKGCPRPVSLKTDVIKHRNRSKGEKKLKEGSAGSHSSTNSPAGSAGGKAKAKKAASRAPSAGAPSTRPSSPTMMDGVQEVDENAADRRNPQQHIPSSTKPGTSIHPDHRRLSHPLPPHLQPSTASVPRPSNSGDALHTLNSHPITTAHPHLTNGNLLSHYQNITAALEARQAATKARESSAAAALVNGGPGDHSSNRRSVSVDGRMTPTSSEQRTDIPYNLAALFSGAIRNDANNNGGREHNRSSVHPFHRKASPSQPSSAASSAASSPAFQPILPHHLFQHQRIRAAAAAAIAAGQQSGSAVGHDGQAHHDPLSAALRADLRSLPHTPADTPPNRSPLFGPIAHNLNGGRASPGPPSRLGSVSRANSPPPLPPSMGIGTAHSTLNAHQQQQQQQPAFISSSSSSRLPASAHPAFSSNSSAGANAVINRTMSSDRLGAIRNSRAFGSTPSLHSGAAINGRVLDPSEEERERQRARLDQLFAAANQRLHEGSRQRAEQERHGSGWAASASTTTSNESAAGEERHQNSWRGRTTSSHHTPGYRPYDLPAHRSSSRPGQHVSISDSRFPSNLSSQRNSPQHTSTSLSHVGKNGRPGSSASSSSDSNAAADPKRGLTGVTSPPLLPYVSPPLTSIPDSMAIDEQEPLSVPPSTHPSASPPFGHNPESGLPPHSIHHAMSERRGRSKTRKHHRDNEVNDVVAQEMNAMRMRDSSRSAYTSRSNSPHPTAINNTGTTSYLASFPGSRIPPATIKTAELDDGIVRDAVTHRPVSDMRASDSPVPTLPSLTSALSSSASSRSISAARSGSRHSAATRRSGSTTTSATMHDDSDSTSASTILPPPHTGFEELQRLRTRIQELEFINGLMESRVAELELSRAFPPHGQSCLCRCAEISESEAQKAAEHLKLELAAHGIKGLGEQASRDLLDLLTQRLGYRLGDLK